MFGTDLYIAIVLGIILSLIYVEKTGIMPAGLIVPGYVALIFDHLMAVVAVAFLSLLTFLIVTQVIGRITVMYGRRKFAAMLAIGVLLKMSFDNFYGPLVPFENFELRGIGVIVPGLIANTIHKQGVIPTFSSTLVISFLTFVFITIYHLF
ncbi:MULTISPECIES: poly-gamma-glutamate biosynthesis protein PgsC [Alteribacter]|uniref:Poly-gamma-glutamate biosynthesis protein PgsC n=1 Tax=Alteribacter keqinensis TaxID=2483800 RepID=A0A3M7TSM2_9BACI|nr:poly-gamma-glutamate biosynthesis protein PgsC [Alteribacter keqinensis]MBM7095660.1 poly-gamma-glutamate biosynthesis protein PgsC [Alteribacter salitolerans]RNA67752.1 poly-gamma-glutamate biosynthesis protein PgsC [Alteribacter keqinensis]